LLADDGASGRFGGLTAAIGAFDRTCGAGLGAVNRGACGTTLNGARGIAQLLRTGWFRPVHVKASLVQEVGAMLTARKRMQAKLMDLEGTVRAILRGLWDLV
jgi:hypothetical protein